MNLHERITKGITEAKMSSEEQQALKAVIDARNAIDAIETEFEAIEGKLYHARNAQKKALAKLNSALAMLKQRFGV